MRFNHTMIFLKVNVTVKNFQKYEKIKVQAEQTQTRH